MMNTLRTVLTVAGLVVFAGAALAQTKAPEIGVNDTKGNTWKLEKLEKDKVYLVEFWATWCATCKKIAPTVAEFVKANRGKGFEFLSVSVDTDRRTLADHLRKENPAYPVLLDPTFEMAKRWDAMAVPRMFLVKNGQIVWQNTGDVTRAQLDTALSRAKG